TRGVTVAIQTAPTATQARSDRGRPLGYARASWARGATKTQSRWLKSATNQVKPATTRSTAAPLGRPVASATSPKQASVQPTRRSGTQSRVSDHAYPCRTAAIPSAATQTATRMTAKRRVSGDERMESRAGEFTLAEESAYLRFCELRCVCAALSAGNENNTRL